MVRYRWYCTVDGTLVAVQDRAAAWKTESCYASFRSNLFGIIVTQKTHAVPSRRRHIDPIVFLAPEARFLRPYALSVCKALQPLTVCVRETEMRVHALASRLSLVRSGYRGQIVISANIY